jgi:DNA mismatch repair ATPase MutS
MLKEKYYKYKDIYDKYLVIIKIGNFYICLNEDAIILSNIFRFKIIESKNFVKYGFPLTSINKVINRLNNIQVNYLIIDNDIIEKEKYTTNNYKLLYRINKIYNILKLKKL